MPKFDYQRLCGGTFFTLVLCALKERKKKREHYKGERDGLSEPEVLLALIKVINPNFVGVELDLIKTPTSRYKSCDISNNAYFPFNDSLLIEHFDQTVKQEYTRSLLLMEEFVQS